MVGMPASPHLARHANIFVPREGPSLLRSLTGRVHLSNIHTHQPYSPLGLDLKLAELPPVFGGSFSF